MLRAPSSVAILLLLASLFSFPQAGYADEGWASWYGPGFHGNVMANGQIYDMNDPTTAAANWWPFGTWIKVTNPANGKSVTVQVRDRGAFKWALDLSYAAFAILDDPKKMMIRVTYEVVPGPDASAPLQPAPTPPAAPVPAPEASSAPKPAPQKSGPPPEEHLVRSGDTLASVARQYGIDLNLLVALNSIENPNVIIPGQRLRLREAPRPAESARNAPSQDVERRPSAKGEYVVQPGDTLTTIAGQLGIDPDTLAALNGIENRNLIAVGQRLRTSQDTLANAGGVGKTASKAHTVVAGETLGSIAFEYGVSQDALASLNGIADPNSILVGQELQIPSSAASTSATEPQQSARKRHVVEEG